MSRGTSATATSPCTRWPIAAIAPSAAGRAAAPSATARTRAPAAGREPTRSSAAYTRRPSSTMTAPDPTPLAHDARGLHAGRGHRQLSHLEALESDSIHIIREVAAEFERPVLLFSVADDSSMKHRL